jgi:hypothetical protein
VIDLAAFENPVVGRSTTRAVVDTHVDALPATRAVRAGHFGADADERLKRRSALGAVADVNGALDFRRGKHSVAVVVEPHANSLPTVRTIVPRWFRARLDQRIFAIVAVDAVFAVNTVFARFPVFTVRAGFAIFAVRAVVDDTLRAVGARHRDEAVALDDGARCALRPLRAVFTAAARDHHHE